MPKTTATKQPAAGTASPHCATLFVALQVFERQDITVADLQVMPAVKILESGLVVIDQLKLLMQALPNL